MRGLWTIAALGLAAATPAWGCLPSLPLTLTSEQAREGLKNQQQRKWGDADRVFLARIERIRTRRLGPRDNPYPELRWRLWLRPIALVKGRAMPSAPFRLEFMDGGGRCGVPSDAAMWDVGKNARPYLIYAAAGQPANGYVLSIIRVDEVIDPVALEAVKRQEISGMPQAPSTD